MKIQEILQGLSPINTKEKVDSLIQKINENRLIFDSKIEMSIRFSIQKLSIQKYFISKFDSQIKDNQIKNERKEKKEEKERKKLIEGKLSLSKAKEVKNAKAKKRKEKSSLKQENKSKYTGSILRTMKIFGSEFKKERKSKKKTFDLNAPLKPGPTETYKSIRTISIASGGMNKRY